MLTEKYTYYIKNILIDLCEDYRFLSETNFKKLLTNLLNMLENLKLKNKDEVEKTSEIINVLKTMDYTLAPFVLDALLKDLDYTQDREVVV